jgi:hypothetical protein
VPSGFFDLPEAENVSAVLFSNAGTIAKFDRMGVVAGFSPGNYTYLRVGLRYNPEPHATEPTQFSEDVGAATYSEFWSKEIEIFHNPNARLPLPPEWLSDLVHHRLRDGQLQSTIPEGHVISSLTWVIGDGADQSCQTRCLGSAATSPASAASSNSDSTATP